MKLIALFGLAAGGILALGNLSAAQWHAVGVALLSLTLRYGLTVLPWVLAALFAVLWWKQREWTQIWREGCQDWTNEALRAQQAELERQRTVAVQRPQRRKRATR
jgi:hypothetical protein